MYSSFKSCKKLQMLQLLITSFNNVTIFKWSATTTLNCNIVTIIRLDYFSLICTFRFMCYKSYKNHSMMEALQKDYCSKMENLKQQHVFSEWKHISKHWPVYMQGSVENIQVKVNYDCFGQTLCSSPDFSGAWCCISAQWWAWGGWLGFLPLFHCPVHKSNAKANKRKAALCQQALKQACFI